MNNQTKTKLVIAAGAILLPITLAFFMPGGFLGLGTILTFPGQAYTYAMANWEFMAILGAVCFGIGAFYHSLFNKLIKEEKKLELVE